MHPDDRLATSSNSSNNYPSRRSVLKTAGIGLTGVGLAGCTGLDGAGGDGGSGDNTVNAVAPLPLSGPYAEPGKQVQNGIKLAIDHAKEDGLVGEVKIEYPDTEVDPSTGRSRTQEVLKKKDINIMIGGFSSGVVASIADLARREQIPLYTMGGGSQPFRQGKCHRYLFTVGSSSWQQAAASYGPALRQGIAEKIYTISADYSGYHQVVDFSKDQVIPENDGTYVGNTYVPIGTGDFSSQIAKVEESDADALGVNLFGSDHVTLVNQAREFGLLEDMVLIAPNHGMSLAREIPNEILSKEYASLNWYWEINAPGAQAYNSSYREQFGNAPSAWGALMYSGFYTALDAMNETGSTNPEDYIPASEGRKYPKRAQMWDRGEHIRACDHQTTVAMQFAVGTPANRLDTEKENYFDVLNLPENPADQMQTCQQAAKNGCKLGK